MKIAVLALMLSHPLATPVPVQKAMCVATQVCTCTGPGGQPSCCHMECLPNTGN